MGLPPPGQYSAELLARSSQPRSLPPEAIFLRCPFQPDFREVSTALGSHEKKCQILGRWTEGGGTGN